MKILNDPIEYIRSNSSRFFRSGKVHLDELSSSLVEEALALGICDINVMKKTNAYIISIISSLFWNGNEPSVFFHEYLTKIIPFPTAGVNSHRVGVVINAVCEDFACKAFGEIKVLRGSFEKEILALVANSNANFVFAFRLK